MLNKQVVKLENSIINEFANIADKKAGCLKLTYGQPNYNTPNVIKNELIRSVNNNRTKYENAQGNIKLIHKIIEYEKSYNNLNYKPDEVLITNGATGAIYIALTTLLNNDDEVIIPCPYYPEYIPVVEKCEGKVILYHNKEYNYQLEYNSLNSLITNKTKCLILTTPNNPTGTILNEKSLEIVYKLVKQYKIYLLIDTCYEKIVFNSKTNFSYFNDIKDYLLICHSFSKTYSMTGFRLGYLLGPKYFIENATKLHQYLNVSVTTFVQDAGTKALDYHPLNELLFLKENMEYAYNRLSKMNLEVTKPDGAFFLFPSIKKFNIDSYTFCKRLIEEMNVAFIPGIAFGTDENIRISICVEFEYLKEALDRFEMFIKKI